VTLAVLALLAAPAAIGAETIGVLAVSDPPGPSPELVEVTSQFRGVLAQTTPGVLEAADLRQRMMGQTPSASLTELERAYSGALATYQAGDYEGAITTLHAVLEDLEKLPDSPETFRQWSRVMLRLARSEQTVGRRAEAEALLERLVRADPGVKVDAAQYPPSFAKQVDEVRARLATEPKRKLTVNSTQKGARVFVDGRDVGLAPVMVPLARGRYRVTGAVQELRAPPIRVDMSEEDQVVSLDFSIAETLRPGSGPGLALGPTDRPKRIVTAAASLGLDRAVTATFLQDGDVTYLQGSVFDVRRGMIQREGRVRLSGKVPPSGGLTALAAFLMTGQASQLVAVAPVAPTPAPAGAAAAVATAQKPQPDLKAAPPKEEAGPQLKAERPAKTGRNSAFMRWSPVATLAIAVGAGAYAVMQNNTASDYYAKAEEMLVGGQLPPGVPPSYYQGYVSDGDSAKSSAQIAGATAGVALVATGVIGYLGYRQTGEFGPIRF
jgi:hypothetical protein